MMATADGAATNNYGFKSFASNGTSINYGISALASGSAGTQNYGGYFDNNATGGVKYGVVGRAIGSSAGDNYGGQFAANSSTGTNYGVQGLVSGSTGITYAGNFANTSTSTSAKYGVYSNTSGNSAGSNYGGILVATGSTESNYGSYGSAYGSTGTNNYGGYFQSIFTGGTSNYGVYGKSTGTTTGTNIGGYFTASGGASNYGLLVESGNVGIGTLTPAYKLHVYQSTTDYVARIENNNNTTNGKGLKINAGSSSGSSTAVMIGFFTPADVYLGGITQSGTGSVLYNSSSDRRLKNNIINTHFGISDLMKIQVRDYVYKADASKTQVTGFIAQELYEIFPNAVTKPANEEDMWSVDYGKVTPLLVKAIQEQQAEIEALKAKLVSLDNLKAENAAMKTDMEALKKAVYGTAQTK
jgi:hypothetical protein